MGAKKKKKPKEPNFNINANYFKCRLFNLQHSHRYVHRFKTTEKTYTEFPGRDFRIDQTRSVSDATTGGRGHDDAGALGGKNKNKITANPLTCLTRHNT